MVSRAHTIIPENESNCVWMDAGLVNYKLCDRNFDCDACPFDVIMRKQHHPFSERAVMQSGRTVTEFSESGVIEKLTEPIRRAPLPDDRLYFSNHTWLKKQDTGHCRIGIDAFLASLLQPVTGAIVVTDASKVAHDSPFAWLLRDQKTYTIHNPVPGVVVAGNSALAAHPMAVLNDCYGEGWIVSLSPGGDGEPSARCYTAEEFRPLIDEALHQIELLLHASLRKQYSAVGSTMYDGGIRVDSIEQFIGEKRYTQFLFRLLRLQ